MKPKVLLTGSTGVVGSAVLKELIVRTDHHIILLIRGGQSAARLNKLLSFLEVDSGEVADRIQVINSDIETTNFNLSPENFAALA